MSSKKKGRDNKKGPNEKNNTSSDNTSHDSRGPSRQLGILNFVRKKEDIEIDNSG